MRRIASETIDDTPFLWPEDAEDLEQASEPVQPGVLPQATFSSLLGDLFSSLLIGEKPARDLVAFVQA